MTSDERLAGDEGEPTPEGPTAELRGPPDRARVARSGRWPLAFGDTR